MEQRVDQNRHHVFLWMYESTHCRWSFSLAHNLLYFMLYQCNVQFHLQVYHYSSHGLADASCVAFQPCKLDILIHTCILLEYWCIQKTMGGINTLNGCMKEIKDSLSASLRASTNFNKVIFKIYYNLPFRCFS